MKILSTALATSSRRRYALKITRADGYVLALTEGDTDATIDGTVYSATQGLTVTDIESTAGLQVGNLEVRTLDDGSVFTAADVAGRRWANASWSIISYDWGNAAAGVEPVLSGVVGEIERRDGELLIELRDLRQYLQQAVGNVSTKTCRARFADWPVPNGNNRCRLSAAAYTVAATITAVSDARRAFTASGLTQAADWFGEGVVTWVSGANAGLSAKVRTHAAGGVITLLLPTVADIAVGDSISVIAGCRGRLDEDCAAKFGNHLNFQGEPHRPTTDQLTSTSTPDV